MLVSELLILAIALSLDAAAVSFSMNLNARRNSPRLLLKAAILFGLFQAIMPIIGYYSGGLAAPFIQSADHWIAFILLSFVGGKMIFDQKKKDTKLDDQKLIVLAIATSIDALVVGLTFNFIKVEVWSSIAIIGVVTFVVSLLLGILGQRCKFLPVKYLGLIGGFAIISIGFKILIEHIWMYL